MQTPPAHLVGGLASTTLDVTTSMQVELIDRSINQFMVDPSNRLSGIIVCQNRSKIVNRSLVRSFVR